MNRKVEVKPDQTYIRLRPSFGRIASILGQGWVPVRSAQTQAKQFPHLGVVDYYLVDGGALRPDRLGQIARQYSRVAAVSLDHAILVCARGFPVPAAEVAEVTTRPAAIDHPSQDVRRN